MTEEQLTKRRESVRRWRLANSEKFKQGKREYRKRNAEKIAEYQREYRQRNPEVQRQAFKAWYLLNRELEKQRSREYYAAHKEDLIEAARIRANRCRAANLERERERSREWQRENREYRREYVRKHMQRYLTYARNRRAKLTASGTHTEDDIADLYKQQKGKCANCHCSLRNLTFHVDHIMPTILGGSNEPFNLQILCPPCNLRKNAKHPDVWAKENGRLF